ncbi:glutamate 5-kinase [Thermophilibacter provencensis]|uniref:glutamate 5-kinase n=1 Tax=Thermophilibacter provencensis TaxID=1852386 RepID=UPI00094B779F|nr:glutamate 5-kinase [Thermophilibacter provencensis]MBM6815073.1 glutamate 5-kinase [Olsenella uli]
MGAPRLLVVKVGSSTLVDGGGALDRAFIRSLCDQVAALVARGTRVVVVSSGAAAAGRDVLGFADRPGDIATLQACAAAGQANLTQAYADVLAERGIPCGQVLLTRRDVMDRDGFLNARSTLGRLLELGAVPVVNENDTVSTAEFAFGDNDMLGALVAALVGADLYVICSDVEGLYTANPQDDPGAELIGRVSEVTHELMSVAGGAGTTFGTGGMASKLRAARAMLAAGIPMVVCRGRRDRVLEQIVSGEAVGTRFEAPAGSPHEGGRKLWIGLAEVPRGTITLDDGAARAVLENGASILPVGVVSTTGGYAAGDVVNVRSPEGDVIGRGVARYSSEDMARVRGIKLDVIARFLGEDRAQPAVHRDDLLVF